MNKGDKAFKCCFGAIWFKKQPVPINRILKKDTYTY